MSGGYHVSEVFYSVQGEGVRAGTANVFLRFAGCNLQCNVEEQGFDCDTDFSSGERIALEALVGLVERVAGECRWIVLTGGEPLLQTDLRLSGALHEAQFKLAIETNGTRAVPEGVQLDWVCVSPKTAEHTLRFDGHVHELKYVRAVGQPIPKPRLRADHCLISPAFEPSGQVKRETLEWCVELVKRNPSWRLSLQLHKFLKVR